MFDCVVFETYLVCIMKDIATPSDQPAEKSTAKALFNYTPQSQREIVLKKGETVTLINSSNKVGISLNFNLYEITHSHLFDRIGGK